MSIVDDRTVTRPDAAGGAVATRAAGGAAVTGAAEPSAARIPRPRGAPDRSRDRVRVLVAVGTDTHPFDRLIDWLEQWYAIRAAEVSMVVQYGRSRPPAIPGAVAFLDHTELGRAMGRSAVVVCHGGPATILEARQHGHLPIVVPRDPGLGEHVDDHQQRFVRRLAAAGMVARCDTQESLTVALDLGVREPAAYAVPVDRDQREAQAAVAQVGRIVEELVAARARRRTRRWWRR